MSRFAGMQYCKTDLVASKGIAFVKYATSSAACMAMETVQMAGMVAGYKVKIMLAEPKTRRTDPTQAFLQGLPGLQHGLLPGAFGGAGAGGPLMPPLSPHGLLGPAMGLQDFGSLGSLGGVGSFGHGGGMGSLGGHTSLGSGMRSAHSGGSHLDMGSLDGQHGLGNGGFGSLGNLNAPTSDYSKLGGGGSLGLSSNSMLSGTGLLGSHVPYQQQEQQQQQQHQQYTTDSVGLPNSRLFIVVHKSAGEEALSALFRCYPGMEYLDLKRDRVTGRSKGYAYVNYTTPAAAGAAQAQLNGIEYPPGTGSRLKVLFAEPLGSMSRPRSGDTVSDSGGVFSAGGGVGTPSNDTGATSFHMSSPTSRDSIGGGSGGGGVGLPGGFGQAALASAAAQQAQQQLSARTDLSSASHDSIISPRSSPLRLSGNTGGGGGDIAAGLGSLTLRDALNGGIGNGSLGGLGGVFPSTGAAAGGRTSPPALLGSHASQGALSEATSGGNGSAGDHVSWRENSPDQFNNTTAGSTGTSAGPSPNKTTSPLHLPPLPSIDDNTVVYSSLNRPLPDYALTHVFQQCGPVEFVRVLPDERVALIKYASAEAAAAAVGSLNGVEVLGEVLQVRSSPPLSFRDRYSTEVGSAS